MPYQQEGGDSASSEYVGAIHARLIVEPDKILQLKRRLEDRRDKIREFVRDNRDVLSMVPAPGADPCSDTTVQLLASNGKAAIDAAQGFVAELDNVVGQLNQIAKDYRLLEEKNVGKFPWPR